MHQLAHRAKAWLADGMIVLTLALGGGQILASVAELLAQQLGFQP